MLYRKLLRPLLFKLDPERAHDLVIAGLHRFRGLERQLGKILPKSDPCLESTVFGISFANPVGLAAGLDKNAEALSAWALLGFGFAEIGTVTQKAQMGNPPKRLFRIPEAGALLNRMGFNNLGVDAVARNLAAAGALSLPIGVNLGRSRDTPNERAHEDYAALTEKLFAHANYFALNLSSPNTPSLRDLQSPASIGALLRAVFAAQDRVRGPLARRPVLVKLSPDLSESDLDLAIGASMEAGANGLIIANTTTDRACVPWQYRSESGGVSGAPLKARSTALIRRARARVGTALPIVGVGGIASAADAYEKIRAGASLVQIWTGLIYEGPSLVRAIARGLARLLARDGFARVVDAIGTEKGPS